MPKPSPKRARLIEVAYRLFYQDGFHAVGIDRILAEAGVAKMTLYHHFPSKDDLIVAVIRWRGAQILQSFRRRIDAAGDLPRHRLEAVFAAHADWLASPGFRGCFLARAIGEYPATDSPARRAAAAEREALAAQLDPIIEGFDLDSPKRLARKIHLLLSGAVTERQATGDPSIIRQAEEAAWTLIEAAPRFID